MDHFITNPATGSVTEIQDVFNWSLRTADGIFRVRSYNAEERTFLWVRDGAREELEATELGA
ncbi:MULTISPECIES: hypothetical protein [unclassified Mesorhizobium]|uniref:hypothetical protein n=1 Tax=unclassified Mesorhizobium TaxID=325217 RepID=UPI000FCBF13C|nr:MULTISPECIES: hypothetical protein [unclassified Mesorhizobium]RUV25868.1 hypothetical protein EOA91_06815 [Mesorhizobium sp. M1A.F.Ca.IN.022.04.1.1]RWG34016.1 MAG: hypothetical protein EOQ60_10380 [Mesorhizobium sp.]TIS18084.1 MAG: hypothetical protein E5X10_00950 [Mesorhizobium sp.]